MEMDGVTEDGEKVDFHEHAWKKAYENLEQMFPKRTVQGWFLCGAPGCQLSPLNYWRQHSQYFPGKNKLMYLNSGLEGEEALYIASEDGFYKLRGYNIYYERNQMMQDYMISRRDIRRVDADVDNKIVRDFRIKLGERKDKIQTEKNLVGALGTLCSILAVTVMAGGIVTVSYTHLLLYKGLHKGERINQLASVILRETDWSGVMITNRSEILEWRFKKPEPYGEPKRGVPDIRNCQVPEGRKGLLGSLNQTHNPESCLLYTSRCV